MKNPIYTHVMESHLDNHSSINVFQDISESEYLRLSDSYKSIFPEYRHRWFLTINDIEKFKWAYRAQDMIELLR